MRSFIGGDDVRLERARLIEAAQRSVDRSVANTFQPAFAEAAQNVVAVAVLLGEDRQHRKVENSLQKLARVERATIDVLHMRLEQYYGLRISARVL